MSKESAIIRLKMLIQNTRNLLYKLERELDKMVAESTNKNDR